MFFKKLFPPLFLWVVIISVLGIGATSATAGPAPPADKPRAGQVVLLIVDRLSWDDLARAKPPNIRRVAHQGSVGLLSNRAFKLESNTASRYLTMATGARATAGGYHGREPSSADIRKLRRINDRTGYPVRVGALRDSLEKLGIKIEVFGNADIPGSQGRVIPGREVAFFGVGAERSASNHFDRLTKLTASNFRGGRLLIIETGATRQADMSGEKRADRRAALLTVDALVGRLTERLDLHQDLLILVSPSAPSGGRMPGQGLTPLIIAGPGFDGGSLRSPSTRREGLVSGTDIAPAITAFFKRPPDRGADGPSLSSLRRHKSFEEMASQANEYLLAERLSGPTIAAYSALQGFLLVLTLTALIFAREFVARNKRRICAVLSVGLALPLAVGLAPLVPGSLAGTSRYVVTLIGLALAIPFLARRATKESSPVVPVLMALIAIFFTINIILGAPADNKSALGYTALTAGRFYGIGNHYLALLVPSAVLAVTLWTERLPTRRRRAALAGAGLALIPLVGLSGYGADVGGVIMTAFTFALAYFSLNGRPISPITLSAAGGLSVLSLGLVAATDFASAGEPSHLGIFFAHLINGTPAEALPVLSRKLSLNIEVFQYSLWSYAVVAVVVPLIGWLAWSNNRPVNWTVDRHPGLRAAVHAIVAGAIVGTLTNDSGISMTAIALGYTLIALLSLEVWELSPAS